MQLLPYENRLDFEWQYVTSGWRGAIFCYDHEGSRYCLKKALTKEFVSNIKREIFVLDKIKALGLEGYTQILASGDDGFVCKWIGGIHFEEAWESGKFSRRLLCVGLLEKAYVLDQHELLHDELHRPMSNVLVAPDGVVSVIDFDQGGFGNISNKNLRHVLQWMLRVQLVSLDELKSCKSLRSKEFYKKLLQYAERIV